MADHDEVLAERHGAVLLLTLNRPNRLNAWTQTMQDSYVHHLRTADADPAIRAIVLTGAGPGFCAGADIATLTEFDVEFDSAGSESLSLPITLRIPVISAINGPVAGVGLIAALFTDLRFAAEDAKFTTAFSQRGLLAEHGVAWILPKLVGLSAALDMLVSPRTFSGFQAQEYGVVDRALPADEVLDAALAYAHTLANESSPTSRAEVKQLRGIGL